MPTSLPEKFWIIIQISKNSTLIYDSMKNQLILFYWEISICHYTLFCYLHRINPAPSITNIIKKKYNSCKLCLVQIFVIHNISLINDFVL